MLDRLYEIAVFYVLDKLFKRLVAALYHGRRHADDRLEFYPHGAGVARHGFVELRSRLRAVQTPRKDAVFNEIRLSRLRSFVVVRYIAAALKSARFENGKAIAPDFLADLPFPLHRLVAEHKVCLALMTEGLVRKHARRLGRENDGIIARLDVRRLFQKVEPLFDTR